MMHVVTGEDIAELISQAADQVEELVRANPEAVIGIATGSTPEPLYAELTRRTGEGLDLSRLRITCLDEYIGLPAEHPQSYRHYIAEQILEPWGIDPAHTVLPDGDAADPDVAAAAFEDGIRSLGGVDLQILGIGPNGHIAFNEPGSPADSRTRVVDLTAETREANSRFFDSIDEVPSQALTQGIGTILESRKAIMLAFGAGKADAVAAMIDGPVDEDVPASALQDHSALEVFLDAAAASRLVSGPPEHRRRLRPAGQEEVDRMRLICQAILFDIDGTLVDSTASVERTWRTWAVEQGIDADAILRTSHGRRSQDVLIEHIPEGQVETAMRRLSELEVSDTDGVIALPGTREILTSLPAGSWAAVTSGERHVMVPRLEIAGLPVPEVLVTSEDVAHGKPDPEGYLAAARQLGVNPAQCLVIEDAPAGIRAGLAAGAHVLGVATSHAIDELTDAHARVSDLTVCRFTPADDGIVVEIGD